MATRIAFTRMVIGSDHGGLDMKEMLKKHVESRIGSIKDVGCYTADRCDYPDIAKEVYNESARGDDSATTLSVYVCGSGNGINMSANKAMAAGDHQSTGCCLLHDVTTARYARDKRNTKAIALGGRVTGTDVAKEILDVFVPPV
ncbi:unnamed protein product [Amoebophrya sp. A25]|nr:unnamed protein product [Amoebophrya sp. A25]|eukprot:GSA25T00003857001.1